MGIIEAIAIGTPGGLLLGATLYVVFRVGAQPPGYTPRPTYTTSPIRSAAMAQTQSNRGLR